MVRCSISEGSIIAWWILESSALPLPYPICATHSTPSSPANPSRNRAPNPSAARSTSRTELCLSGQAGGLFLPGAAEAAASRDGHLVIRGHIEQGPRRLRAALVGQP